MQTADMSMNTRSEERSLISEWRIAVGRGLALWATLGTLAYRLILWQDTGEWLPLTLNTVAGMRLDLSWIGLQSAATWLTGLPVEAWFIGVGGLLLLVGRRSGNA